MLTSDSFSGESLGARLLDQSLRAYPMPRGERCDQAVCRRLAFIYGVAVRHANVNERTHSTMHELFGPTDMTMMSHLSRMARVERTVSAQGFDDYIPNLERLRLPITFVSGKHNMVWVPESTERTYSLLVTELGQDLFRRVVFDGYGHQDVLIGASGAARYLSHGARAPRPGQRLTGAARRRPRRRSRRWLRRTTATAFLSGQPTGRGPSS